jgi:hypothetical protein
VRVELIAEVAAHRIGWRVPPIESDQVVGLAFMAGGLAIIVWGARELYGARRRGLGARGLVGRALGGGLRLWGRITAVGLVVCGTICLLAGLYLVLNLRNL